MINFDAHRYFIVPIGYDRYGYGGLASTKEKMSHNVTPQAHTDTNGYTSIEEDPTPIVLQLSLMHSCGLWLLRGGGAWSAL